MTTDLDHIFVIKISFVYNIRKVESQLVPDKGNAPDNGNYGKNVTSHLV